MQWKLCWWIVWLFDCVCSEVVLRFPLCPKMSWIFNGRFSGSTVHYSASSSFANRSGSALRALGVCPEFNFGTLMERSQSQKSMVFFLLTKNQWRTEQKGSATSDRLWLLGIPYIFMIGIGLKAKLSVDDRVWSRSPPHQGCYGLVTSLESRENTGQRSNSVPINLVRQHKCCFDAASRGCGSSCVLHKVSH